MDNYRIDSHKLMYHPGVVSDWAKGKDIYPIYVEVAPCGGCNHRCIFCALDYLGHKPVCIETAVLKKFLHDIASKGTKSIMFAGEGEPLLHKDFPDLVSYAKKQGLDVSITTNGVLLKKELNQRILPFLSWIRISLNAGTAQNYGLIHRTNPRDFDTVIKNIREALAIKRKNKLAATIGVQFLLLNQNFKEAEKLAAILKKIGADYLIIKPYSQHPKSLNRLKRDLSYRSLLSLEESLEKYEGTGFNVIFRKSAMLKIQEKKPYNKCCGLSFWSYLSAEGDLYACSAFLGDKRFCYGNIYQESFTRLWNGRKRHAINRMMDKRWDIKKCREVCRLDEVNRYLWDLKHPHPHVNFI